MRGTSSTPEPQKNRAGYDRWGWFLLGGTALAATTYMSVQGIRCRRALHDAVDKRASYPAKTVHLSYGEITYLDIMPTGSSSAYSDPPVILSLHGIYGGYDQAFENVRDLSEHYRIIAPSRFGYPGSSVAGEGTPKEQAAALMALLDILNIETVYVLGASAGGTLALRFALDYPERTTGLILLSSAPPQEEKPRKLPTRMGPPAALNHDYVMWLLSPFFKPLFGLPSNTIYGMLPLRERRMGAKIDTSITNPDMAVHLEEYPIESLEPPVFLIHAQDDRVVPFAQPRGHVQSSMYRYPNLTTCIFETGGHMIEGHSKEVTQAVIDFIDGIL